MVCWQGLVPQRFTSSLTAKSLMRSNVSSSSDNSLHDVLICPTIAAKQSGRTGCGIKNTPILLKCVCRRAIRQHSIKRSRNILTIFGKLRKQMARLKPCLFQLAWVTADFAQCLFKNVLFKVIWRVRLLQWG